jgi:hypothetical protein
MFKRLVRGSALLILCILGFDLAPLALGSCNDAVIRFNDEAEIRAGKGVTRQITSVMFCEGGSLAVPQMTSVHFLEEVDGRLCYRDMTCGNLTAWEGYVAVKGSWIWQQSLGKFLGGSNGIVEAESGVIASLSRFGFRDNYNGGQATVYVAVDWGNVQRFCKEPSAQVCL